MTGLYMTRQDIIEGGKAAGAYLTAIGKTDLSGLTQDEWQTFCVILVNEANQACGRRFLEAWSIPMGAEG